MRLSIITEFQGVSSRLPQLFLSHNHHTGISCMSKTWHISGFSSCLGLYRQWRLGFTAPTPDVAVCPGGPHLLCLIHSPLSLLSHKLGGPVQDKPKTKGWREAPYQDWEPQPQEDQNASRRDRWCSAPCLSGPGVFTGHSPQRQEMSKGSELEFPLLTPAESSHGEHLLTHQKYFSIARFKKVFYGKHFKLRYLPKRLSLYITGLLEFFFLIKFHSFLHDVCQ